MTLWNHPVFAIFPQLQLLTGEDESFSSRNTLGLTKVRSDALLVKAFEVFRNAIWLCFYFISCVLMHFIWIYFYLPQRSWGKVMFLHLSVILFTGGCLPHPWTDTPPGRHPLGRHPQGRPPWADTPWADTRPGQTLALGRHPLSRHPPWQTPHWADTPWADTPQAYTPLGRHPTAQCMLRYTPHPVHAGIWSTSGRYASYWNAFLSFDYIKKVDDINLKNYIQFLHKISKRYFHLKFQLQKKNCA